jgi:excinuclease ABC subunit A
MNPIIKIRGAREHNLKNLDLDIPRDKLVVFTGVSGSGKSSLAFDTIYAEGQRSRACPLMRVSSSTKWANPMLI